MNDLRLKTLAIKLADNTRIEETVLGPGDSFPIVALHQKRLDQLGSLGYELVTVDNGIGYFKKKD